MYWSVKWTPIGVLLEDSYESEQALRHWDAAKYEHFVQLYLSRNIELNK